MCMNCPAGTASQTTGSQTQVDCQACLAGQYSPPGSSVCSKCPGGTYSNTSSQASCTPCPAGTFAGNNIGPIGSTSCASCTPGQYSGSGQTACSSCPPGTFTDANSDYTACTLCPSGSYQPNAAQVSCLPCPSGQTSWIGAVQRCAPACTTSSSTFVDQVQGTNGQCSATFGQQGSTYFVVQYSDPLNSQGQYCIPNNITVSYRPGYICAGPNDTPAYVDFEFGSYYGVPQNVPTIPQIPNEVGVLTYVNSAPTCSCTPPLQAIQTFVFTQDTLPYYQIQNYHNIYFIVSDSSNVGGSLYYLDGSGATVHYASITFA